MGADADWHSVLTGAATMSGDFVHGRRADSLFDMVFDIFDFDTCSNEILFGCQEEMGAKMVAAIYYIIEKGRGSALVVFGARSFSAGWTL
jgi:hypothetical protein